MDQWLGWGTIMVLLETFLTNGLGTPQLSNGSQMVQPSIHQWLPTLTFRFRCHFCSKFKSLKKIWLAILLHFCMKNKSYSWFRKIKSFDSNAPTISHIPLWFGVKKAIGKVYSNRSSLLFSFDLLHWIFSFRSSRVNVFIFKFFLQVPDLQRIFIITILIFELLLEGIVIKGA